MPGRNLGFGGGSNFGAQAAGADLLFFLNPDARPAADALAALCAGFATWPQAAGLVPRLVGFDGAPQADWQLRRLPTPLALLAHALFWNPGAAAAAEPAAGAAIEQPAAAALALRRSVFEALGGFDEAFYPAWFEDVDLARRLADRGQPLLYLPEALCRHRQGSSVGALGYGAFLAAYDRNLCRYLDKHHGHAWAIAFRALAGPAALLRLLLLPLRLPTRAATRTQVRVQQIHRASHHHAQAAEQTALGQEQQAFAGALMLPLRGKIRQYGGVQRPPDAVAGQQGLKIFGRRRGGIHGADP